MLGYYLRKRDPDSRGGCRGGVGHVDGDYLIEIGQNCHADPETVAFLVHMPEIREFLKLTANDSPLVGMILRSIKATTNKIQEGLK